MDIIEFSDNDDTIFCLTIDYFNNLENPSKLFLSISNIINALKLTDETLISSFDVSYEPSFILSNIENGSIKIFILQTLKNIPDDALIDLNFKRIIGSFLVKGKRNLIKIMEKDVLDDSNEIEKIKTTLYEEAKKLNISQINNYNYIDNSKIIFNINNLSNNVKQLPEKSNVYYSSWDPNLKKEYKSKINKNFKISEELLNSVNSERIETNINTMIVKIKQPDYVSNAMWTFKYNNSLISAKFEDKVWLNKFQNRQIDVKPKDALLVSMKITNYFDKNNFSHDTKYAILEVIKVIQYNQANQISIDDL
ncbi:hypothetical protein [Sedimentibacter sp. MB31-C6]|uniref:hypothetical protein n=1 Tax=Sedimentibacter sp. MB31-C6 TaxID=3109366 RepID=UPI002DDCCFB2|nr:hypothetical protein [Sedimentibacter sp. MB36-C1]WSI05098.1 hypothetical protein U8307_04715 [Sedimentibacter sp. MB36-C1]